MKNLKSDLTRKEKKAYIKNYTPLAKRLAAKYSSKKLFYDDCFQEAMLGLIIATNNFDKSRGLEFGALAKTIITNRLKSLYFNEKKQPVAYDFNSEEYDDETPNSCRTLYSVSDDIRNKKTLCDDGFVIQEVLYGLEQIADRIGEAENWRQIVFMKIVMDMSQDECAKMLNISQPTLSRIIKKVREEYKNEKTS